MKHFSIILILFLMGCAETVEPDPRTFVVEGLIGDGDLANYPIKIQSYDPESNALGPMENVRVNFKNITSEEEVQLIKQNSDEYTLDQGTLVNNPGDAIELRIVLNTVLSRGFTKIPSMPDSLSVSSTKLELENFYKGERIDISWIPEQNEGFMVQILLDSSSQSPFPTMYLESLPGELPRVEGNQIYTDGLITLNPWDFGQSGKWNVVLNYCGPNLVKMMDNPVQGYILESTNGLSDGLGYFSGMVTDTISITISF